MSAGLWSFVAIKISGDGTLVPKHVGVGTSHEECLMICVILYLTWCVLLFNILNEGNVYIDCPLFLRILIVVG